MVRWFIICDSMLVRLLDLNFILDVANFRGYHNNLIDPPLSQAYLVHVESFFKLMATLPIRSFNSPSLSNGVSLIRLDFIPDPTAKATKYISVD